MLVVMGQALKGLDGVSLKTQGDGGERPVKLSEPLVNALLSDFRDETVDGAEKFKRYQLAAKVTKAAEGDEPLEVTAEEVALCKKLIGKAYTPALVGPVYLALEGNAPQVE